jgi:hypothetical protein
MALDQEPLARRLQAVGHILDQRGAFKEVLVHQADDGFIVHALAAHWGTEQSQWTPTTILIEESEVRDALASLALPVGAPAKAEKRWWR